MSVPAERFVSGALTNGLFIGSPVYIQTDNTITLSFTLKNDLPGYVSGSSHPKIVIIMPREMTRSSGSVVINGLDGSIREIEMNVANTDYGREESF